MRSGPGRSKRVGYELARRCTVVVVDNYRILCRHSSREGEDTRGCCDLLAIKHTIKHTITPATNVLASVVSIMLGTEASFLLLFLV